MLLAPLSILELMRPAAWVEESGATVGGVLCLNMPEMGVRGEANVLAIDAAPPLRPGPGRPVTGTFRHTSGEVYDLKLEAERTPIGVTASHPFWSCDRHAWVPAIDLRIGEAVKMLTGTTIVEKMSKRPAPEPVYNIEVDGDHVYRVGVSGVLVHNASAPSECCDPPEGYAKSLGTITTNVSWFNNGSIVVPVAAEGLITEKSVAKGGAEFDTGPTNPVWWRDMITAFPDGDWARGHLIGNALGGPGHKAWWNMVPLHRRANNPGMWNCEKKIRDAARDGHCVKLTVTVTYGNRKVIPSFIRMEAVSLNSDWRLGPVNIPNQLAATSPCS